MKKVKIEDAIGMMLPHDMTQIIPGEFKGVAFKKGHIIKKEDIPILKSIGKEHIYILQMPAGHLHEMEGAKILAQSISGSNTTLDEAREGKVNIRSTCKGVLKINREALLDINMIDGLKIATKYNNTPIEVGTNLAGAKITPLTIEKTIVEEAKNIVHNKGKVIEVRPFKNLKIGCIITGNEVYNGIIEDKFEDVFRSKAEKYCGEIVEVIFCPDDSERICQNVFDLKSKGVEMILTSGGMSVDPDDVTPEGIKTAGARLVSYGSPVFPGAMFMLAYLGEMPILGIPAATIFHDKTILDFTFPRLLTGEKLNAMDIAELGNGGLL